MCIPFPFNQSFKSKATYDDDDAAARVVDLWAFPCLELTLPQSDRQHDLELAPCPPGGTDGAIALRPTPEELNQFPLGVTYEVSRDGGGIGTEKLEGAGTTTTVMFEPTITEKASDKEEEEESVRQLDPLPLASRPMTDDVEPEDPRRKFAETTPEQGKTEGNTKPRPARKALEDITNRFAPNDPSRATPSADFCAGQTSSNTSESLHSGYEGGEILPSLSQGDGKKADVWLEMVLEGLHGKGLERRKRRKERRKKKRAEGGNGERRDGLIVWR